MWRSLVAHFVRDEGAVGSNPAIPILQVLLFTTASRLLPDHFNQTLPIVRYGELFVVWKFMKFWL